MWPNPDPAAPQHLGQYIAIFGLPWGPLPATGTLPCCGGPHLSRGPSWPWGPIPAMGTISSTGTMAILGTPPCHGGPHPCHGGRHPPREHSQPRRSLPGPPLARLPPEFLPGPPLPVPSGPPYPPPGGTDPGTHPFSSRLCRAGGDHRSRPTGSGAARRRDEPSCRRSLCGAGAPVPPAPPVPPVPPVLPVPTVPPAGAAGLGGGGERGWGWPGAGRPRRDRGRALGSTGRSHVSARTVLTVYALLGREVAAGDGLHRDGSAAG